MALLTEGGDLSLDVYKHCPPDGGKCPQSSSNLLAGELAEGSLRPGEFDQS